MSLWKWNDVELEIDMQDFDFTERYEKSLEQMGEREKTIKRIGAKSVVIKEYCEMFNDFFDALFGEGTAKKLFAEKKNTRLCEEAYFSLIEALKKDVSSANEQRQKQMKKYQPNRAQRRAQSKGKK